MCVWSVGTRHSVASRIVEILVSLFDRMCWLALPLTVQHGSAASDCTIIRPEVRVPIATDTAGRSVCPHFVNTINTFNFTCIAAC